MDAPDRPGEPGRRVLAVCPHDCPDTCGMIARVVDGRLQRVEGNALHPFTRGHLCRKVAHYEERVYSPDRVLHPMRRSGPKGSGAFERISWEEALDTIVTRWRAAIREHGPEAMLPYSYAGTMGVVNGTACEGRLWVRMGASRLERTICSSAAEAGYGYTMGWSGGMDPEAFALSRFIIAWGTNLCSTNVHQMAIVREAQRRGASFVVIDPFRTRTADCADWFLQPRPGTDTALALSMMQVLFSEGLHDEAYLERHTIGWRQLRERASEYPPDRAAGITGLPAADITALARRYATEQPSAIRMGYGLTRTSNGGMMARALTCLPAVIGGWGKPGGGLLLSTSAQFTWDRTAVQRTDLAPGPPPRAVNMNRLGVALTELGGPPVQCLMVWNSNPAAVAPNSNLVLRGLAREDLFTVVHEQVMTDTARYADIVLPATSQMEHMDLHFAYGHLYVQLNQPAIEPLGEARPNVEVQHELARRMGFTEPCFRETAEDIIRAALGSATGPLEGITLEMLRERGFAKLRMPTDPFVPFVDGQGFRTPSGKIELCSEWAGRDGYDRLPAYAPPGEAAGAEMGADAGSLCLLTPAAHHFLNSTFSNLVSLQAAEREARIWLHPADAGARGVGDGDRVRVWNARGSVELRAVVSDRARPGVAWSPSLWWHCDSPGGRNVNALTSDRLSDMGGGSTFHTNLVQVARLETDEDPEDSARLDSADPA